MTAKNVLVRPQGLRRRSRAPTCPPLLRDCVRRTFWDIKAHYRGISAVP